MDFSCDRAVSPWPRSDPHLPHPDGIGGPRITRKSNSRSWTVAVVAPRCTMGILAEDAPSTTRRPVARANSVRAVGMVARRLGEVLLEELGRDVHEVALHEH